MPASLLGDAEIDVSPFLLLAKGSEEPEEELPHLEVV